MKVNLVHFRIVAYLCLMKVELVYFMLVAKYVPQIARAVIRI